MNIYIAGPMTGYPNFNFPAFFEAEKLLNSMGHATFNPARRDNEAHGTDISEGNETGSQEQAAAQHGFNLREALGADLAWICATADAIYLLPGWEKSRGALAEYHTARALGLKVVFHADAETGSPAEQAFEHGYANGYSDGYLASEKAS